MLFRLDKKVGNSMRKLEILMKKLESLMKKWERSRLKKGYSDLCRHFEKVYEFHAANSNLFYIMFVLIILTITFLFVINCTRKITIICS